MNRFAAREIATFSPDLSHGASRLYQALDEYARESGTCFPSQRILTDRTGIPPRSLKRYLAQLIENGMVTTERRTPGGGNRYGLSYHGPLMAPPGAMVGPTLGPLVAPLYRKKQDIETVIPPLPPATGGIQCLVCDDSQTRIMVSKDGFQAVRRWCPACGGNRRIA